MDKEKIVGSLDKIAGELEVKGLKDVAMLLDKASDALEAKQASAEGTEKWAFDESVANDDLLKDVDASVKEAVQKEVAGEIDFLKMAVDECYAADAEVEAAMQTIEAAKKRKKKWIQKIDIKKGRLTEYKKPGESMDEAARRALKSDDKSVRSMGSLYMAFHSFKKKKKGKKD